MSKKRWVKIRGTHRMGRLRANDAARMQARGQRPHPGTYEALAELRPGPLTIRQLTARLVAKTHDKRWIYNRTRKVLLEAEVKGFVTPLGPIRRGPPPTKWALTDKGRGELRAWQV